MSSVDVAVVGAGAAGLAAAHGLRSVGRSVRVFERAPRAGGVMQSEAIEGFLYERGPNTFRVGPDALALLQHLGLEAALRKASPVGRERYLFRDGRLQAVPLGPLSLVSSPLLSGAGKRRLLKEAFVPRGPAERETVAEFVSRRLGPEVSDALVGPFLVGVYAGDEHQLGAEAVFPSLVEMERAHGSITVGALRSALGGGASGIPGTYSGPEGMGSLANLLARPLGDALALETAVHAIAREGSGWQLDTAEGDVHAAAVVVATPAEAAASLLESVDAEIAAFCRGVHYAPAVSVALDVGPDATAHPLRGFGFLVPREAGIDLLGALFMSQLFTGRAPGDRALVSAMIGGLRWPDAADVPDDELLKRVFDGLDRTLGLRSEPRVLGISRWPRGIPQPGVGHPAAVRAMEARAAALPGLALIGNYVHGVGLGDTLGSGWTLRTRLPR